MKKMLFKVLMIGEAGVGKTSILNQYISQNFKRIYKATIGCDFMTKMLPLKDATACLQIWDTAGQERYQSLGTAFYRGTDACLIVFDITNSDSFKQIDTWKNLFLEHGPFFEPETFPLVLVGNKVDREEERQVSAAEALVWCQANGAIYFEVSAKDNVMIEDVFQGLADKMYERKIRRDKEDINEFPIITQLDERKKRPTSVPFECCY